MGSLRFRVGRCGFSVPLDVGAIECNRKQGKTG